MATSSGRSPRHGGSHFGGGAPEGRARTNGQPTGAQAPRTAVPTARLSSRTAAATRRAGSHSVQRERSRHRSRAPYAVLGLLAVAAVLAVVLVVLPALSGGSNDDRQTVTPGTTVTVTVAEGSGASAVADALYDAGVIASRSEFLNQVRRTEAEQSIKSGTYEIVTGADLASIIDLLTTGPNASATLTIPEGYTVSQIAAAAEQAFGIPADEFLAQAKASNYAAEYTFLSEAHDDSLEGYLFPKTYSFPDEGATADALIRAMLAQYQTEVASLDLASAAASISSRYGIDVDENDLVIVASIIEREAGGDEHRADVASVFYNRLETGMMLQSDATLVYSLGREVTADDLKNDDPYNTYTNYGLTPTPICSPGLASLQAAANPNDTDYLYFFLSGDYAAFSVTLDEHNQAIANRPQ